MDEHLVMWKVVWRVWWTPSGCANAGVPARNASAARAAHQTREETRECLTVLAIADEAEAARRGDVARDAAHAAAPATKGKVQGHALHRTERLRRRGVGDGFHGHVKTIRRNAVESECDDEVNEPVFAHAMADRLHELIRERA